MNFDNDFDPISRDQFARMRQLERVKIITANYTATRDDDFIFANTTGGPITLTLPLARNGQHFVISRPLGANNLTVVPSGAELIHNAASITITTNATRLKSITGVGYYLI